MRTKEIKKFKSMLPRRWNDCFCFLLTLICVPSVFLFETFTVVPTIHIPGGLFYAFTLTVAVFILWNIMGNWMACILVDTSVDYELTASDMHGWRYCKDCNKLAPPRSWHCRICRLCILKRNHHCLFTACCIGHRNHRYFIMFLVFLLVGSIYAFVYNSYYIWVLKAPLYRNWSSLYKIVCPLLIFFTESAWNNIHILLYNINFLGVIYSVILLLYHVPLILHGNVCYENNRQKYDFGWKHNLITVFGKRMHLVWISPFVRSELINDGSEWKHTKQM